MAAKADSVDAGLFTPEICTNLEAQALVLAWCDALESGKYRKGVGALRGECGAEQSETELSGCFCCLGVACDVSRLDTWQGRIGGWSYDWHSISLPEKVRGAFCLSERDGEGVSAALLQFTEGEETVDLITLNDCCIWQTEDRLSFVQIAGAIREELRKALEEKSG